ncbi:MAG: hypothetical protein HY559_00980 [Gammaproteobacteria bacterium]|nr:hypothetical protein [Gammaproteobacteria bacterium]
MTVPNEVTTITEGVISSFESGIGGTELLIEKGLEILDGSRREHSEIRGDLREKLASIGNLRKKDFDGVMEQILSFQLRRESELKGLIRSFLANQKALAGRLKKSLQAGILDEVERFKQEIIQMQEEARTHILEFQKEQEEIRTTFEKFYGKGNISARHFKQVVSELEKTLKGGGEHDNFSRHTEPRG